MATRPPTLPAPNPARPASRPSGASASSAPAATACGRPADGPVVMYGWHTVTAALRNPARRLRKLLATENAARRLADEGIDPPSRRRSGAALRDRRAAHARRRASGPLSGSRSAALARGRGSAGTEASCWCSTRSPTRTMSAPFSARPRPLPRRPSSPRSGTRRTPPARWPRPPPARSNTCRWSACRTWRAGSPRSRQSGFLVVGLDCERRCRSRDLALARAARAGARRRGQGPAPAHQGNLRPRRPHRPAGRDQEPERVERGGARALCGEPHLCA